MSLERYEGLSSRGGGAQWFDRGLEVERNSSFPFHVYLLPCRPAQSSFEMDACLNRKVKCGLRKL